MKDDSVLVHTSLDEELMNLLLNLNTRPVRAAAVEEQQEKATAAGGSVMIGHNAPLEKSHDCT